MGVSVSCAVTAVGLAYSLSLSLSLSGNHSYISAQTWTYQPLTNSGQDCKTLDWATHIGW